jgi:alpha-L-fucosidase
MTILIDNEAKRQLESLLDFEFYGNRFKTENNLYTFPDLNLETIEKNLFYLLRNSVEIDFELKYKYRPDYLSFDTYGTTILWELIMYVNEVFSIEDFNLIKVVLPSMDSIVSIFSDLYKNQQENPVCLQNG